MNAEIEKKMQTTPEIVEQMHVERKKVFSFNGIIFSTKKAFADEFPAFRTYADVVAQGEATNVQEIEQIIRERKGRQVGSIKANARRLARIQIGRKKGGNG